jgi:hypothetical protein
VRPSICISMLPCALHISRSAVNEAPPRRVHGVDLVKNASTDSVSSRFWMSQMAKLKQTRSILWGRNEVQTALLSR